MLNPTDATPVAPTPESAPATGQFSLKAYRAERAVSKTAEPAAVPTSEAPAPVTPQEDETDDATSESAEGTAELDQTEIDQDGKPKKQGGFQKRITKLVGERDALIAEREALKAQLAGNTSVPPAAKREETPSVAPAPAAFTEPEPQLEDFENIGQYTKALLKWDRAQANHEQAQQSAARQQTMAQQAAVESWTQRQTEAKAKHADYDAALAAVQEIAIPPALQQTLIESEHGPEVAYHLAKHPDELKRIAGMSPLAAARAIGKIESAFSSTTDTKPNRISSAPAPIRTVAAKPAAGAFDVKNASLKDWRLAREQGRVR